MWLEWGNKVIEVQIFIPLAPETLEKVQKPEIHPLPYLERTLTSHFIWDKHTSTVACDDKKTYW